MKIVCAGYWKTGTKSLAQALRILGYKVYDYDDQFFILGDLWDKFFAGTVTDDDIREQLKDVDVLIDGPVIAFWSEIHRAIPETKVILTIRDEDSWWKSFLGMMKSGPYIMRIFFLLFLFVPAGHQFMRLGMRVGNLCQGIEGLFTFQWLKMTNNPRLYKMQFRKHNAYVLQTVAKESLLVFKPGEGWEPLCNFLGKDVPTDQPYPHKNKEGAHFKSEGGPQNPKIRTAAFQVLVLISLWIVFFAYCIYYMMYSLF